MAFDGVSYQDVLPDGTMVAADTENHQVRIIGPEGEQLRVIGGEAGDGAGMLRNPQGVEAADDRIWNPDTGNDQVVKQSLAGLTRAGHQLTGGHPDHLGRGAVERPSPDGVPFAANEEKSMRTMLKRTTAIAALAALPLAPIAAHAQSQSDQGAQSQTDLVPSDKDIKIYKSQKDTAGERSEVIKKDGEYIERSTQAEGQQGEQTGQQAQGQQTVGEDADVMQGQNTQAGVIPGTGPVQELTPQEQALAADALIATVGDTQIRRSDVLDVIALLPPQLQQQPAEMLIPMAIDQLVTRELILQEARGEGLAEDEEVVALTIEAEQLGRENAMVQVWLERSLEDAVTEAEIENTYETIRSELGEGAPPLSQIRPEIEQELRRQAFAEISSVLHGDAEIIVYGPGGQPINQ